VLHLALPLLLLLVAIKCLVAAPAPEGAVASLHRPPTAAALLIWEIQRHSCRACPKSPS